MNRLLSFETMAKWVRLRWLVLMVASRRPCMAAELALMTSNSQNRLNLESRRSLYDSEIWDRSSAVVAYIPRVSAHRP